jgi:hypothetical protein
MLLVKCERLSRCLLELRLALMAPARRSWSRLIDHRKNTFELVQEISKQQQEINLRDVHTRTHRYTIQVYQEDLLTDILRALCCDCARLLPTAPLLNSDIGCLQNTPAGQVSGSVNFCKSRQAGPPVWSSLSHDVCPLHSALQCIHISATVVYKAPPPLLINDGHFSHVHHKLTRIQTGELREGLIDFTDSVLGCNIEDMQAAYWH